MKRGGWHEIGLKNLLMNSDRNLYFLKDIKCILGMKHQFENVGCRCQ